MQYYIYNVYRWCALEPSLSSFHLFLLRLIVVLLFLCSSHSRDCSSILAHRVHSIKVNYTIWPDLLKLKTKEKKTQWNSFHFLHIFAIIIENTRFKEKIGELGATNSFLLKFHNKIEGKNKKWSTHSFVFSLIATFYFIDYACAMPTINSDFSTAFCIFIVFYHV